MGKPYSNQEFRYHYNDVEYAFFSKTEIIKMLKKRIDPYEFNENAHKITTKGAKKLIKQHKLFVKNDGSNGLLAPSGHFVPCNYEGHLFLYCALGIESTFESDGTIDLTPDIVGDRTGWIKISDGIILPVYQPSSAQIRTVKAMGDFINLKWNKDFDQNPLSRPPNGYQAFMFEKISKTRKLEGLYDYQPS